MVDQYLDWVAKQEESEIMRAERDRIAAAATGDGTPADVTEIPRQTDASVDAPYESGRWGSGEVQIDEARFLDADNTAGHVFSTGDVRGSNALTGHQSEAPWHPAN